MIATVIAAPAGSSGSATRHHRLKPAAACGVPGAGEPIDQIWRPDMGAALAYARHRAGDIAFAVRTPGRFYGYRADHVEWSASVVKAMLMVAYLDQRSVAGRPLNGYDTSLLVPMITRSDNSAASTVDRIVGNAGLRTLADRVGMTHFVAVAQPWGETQITARDQTKFFLYIDRYLAPRHRSFATRLLASITPSQRWGIGEVAPPGWQLFFKGGWGSGTGLLDHQVVLLTRGCARVSLAVLSMYDGSHDYGKATLRGIFARLLARFPTGAPLYPVVDGAHYSGVLVGDTSSRRSQPGGTAVDGVSFRTSGHGRRVQGFQLTLVNDLKDTCPAGKLAPLRLEGMTPDPRGRFATQGSRRAFRYAVSGRFLSRRRAAGTVTEADVDPLTQRVTCQFQAGWLARVIKP